MTTVSRVAFRSLFAIDVAADSLMQEMLASRKQRENPLNETLKPKHIVAERYDTKRAI